MAYDVRSQIVGRCQADANSPIGAVMLGLQLYTETLGILPSKLVLGVPWYGFDYPCITGSPGTISADTAGSANTDARMASLLNSTVCSVAQVGFRGAPCSDAAGGEQPLVSVLRMLDAASTPGSAAEPVRAGPRLWDATTSTPYFNYLDQHGVRHQLWYDDAESTALKLEAAVGFKVAGFGPYEFSDLDFVPGSNGANETAAMWAVLRKYATMLDVAR